MSRYIEVPAPALRDMLTKAGFELRATGGREEVYQRAHDRDNRYVIRVYSSISVNASVTRGCGEDAIRVVALFFRDAEAVKKDRAVPLYKGKRIHRTGSVEKVLERTLGRMREAYTRCSGVIANQQANDNTRAAVANQRHPDGGPSVRQVNFLRALMKECGDVKLFNEDEVIRSSWREVSNRIARYQQKRDTMKKFNVDIESSRTSMTVAGRGSVTVIDYRGARELVGPHFADLLGEDEPETVTSKLLRVMGKKA